MKFTEAVKKKKIVVVAGAGISKDSPANLPSWWDYNMILLECIGKMGANTISEADNLLNADKIKEKIPITSISEFFVDRIAGKSYFPLLSMLDGSHPNIHHFMLAQLAEQGIIKAIVTTNYDTLIEKAFMQKNIPIKVFDVSEDFYNEDNEHQFPIYKIHGSADKPDFAIDTVHQKLRGLSYEKTCVLKNLFQNNHILFIGFSGEDFLFGTDYIPIRANRHLGYGITWLSYPGSTFNDNTKKLINELNINVIEKTLPEFYTEQGWLISDDTSHIEYSSKNTFRKNAEIKILELLDSPHIGKWSCLGMCIELLDIVQEKEKLDKVVAHTKRILKGSLYKNPVEEVTKLSLYSNLVSYFLSKKLPDDALYFCNKQLSVLKLNEMIAEHNGTDNRSNKSYQEIMLNKSTVLNHIGLIISHFFLDYKKAYYMYWNVFYSAFIAQHWENISYALMNISLTCSFIWNKDNKIQDGPHFVAVMERARKVAEFGGYAQPLFEINCKLSQMYTSFGQRKLAEELIKRAEENQKLCISQTKNTVLLSKTKKELYECSERNMWSPLYTKLCMPIHYDSNNYWEVYSQYPILSCKEGQQAKLLFDNGKKEESLRFMIYTAAKCNESGNYETAHMLLDCAASIFIDIANNAAQQKNVIIYSRNLENARICYDNCLKSEFSMGRLDYIVKTLGSLSKVHLLLADSEYIQLAFFQAELALCLCDDPTECWEIILAAEVACRICKIQGNNRLAIKYCTKYMSMVKIAPWGTDQESFREMLKIHQELNYI